MIQNLKYYNLVEDKKGMVSQNASSMVLSSDGKKLVCKASCWVNTFLTEDDKKKLIALNKLIKCAIETLI